MALKETEISQEAACSKSRLRLFLLAAECSAFFFAVPVILYFHATRLNVHAALWVVALYAIVHFMRMPGFSWRNLWRGNGWSLANRKMALARFFILTLALVILARILAPDRLFGFPLERPGFWLIVMVLYPILSVVPQEFVLRSFFFRRYRELFPGRLAMIAASAISFAFVHIVFHNPVSPLLCLAGGAIFSHSYANHQSLKWAVIEHAAYGCMVFTVGLGFYFLVGGMRI